MRYAILGLACDVDTAVAVVCTRDADAGLGCAKCAFYRIVDHAAYIDPSGAGDVACFGGFDIDDGGGLIDADGDGAADHAAPGIGGHGGDHVRAFAQEEAREAEGQAALL